MYCIFYFLKNANVYNCKTLIYLIFLMYIKIFNSDKLEAHDTPGKSRYVQKRYFSNFMSSMREEGLKFIEVSVQSGVIV